MNDTKRGPEVRVRLKHTQTAKGWRLDESTVEVVLPLESEGDPNYLHHILQSEMYAAHQSGRDEADRRNHQDGYS